MALFMDVHHLTDAVAGWIKADSNYVISALAKRKAEDSGYMEVLFLDAVERDAPVVERELSAADKAGIEATDIILKFDGKPVESLAILA